MIGALAMIFTTTVCQAQRITKQEIGYFNIIELGVFPGAHTYKVDDLSGGVIKYNDPATAVSLRVVNGWFITNQFSLGLGVGQENFAINGGFVGSNLFQVFGDVRYYFKNQKATFFAYGQAGPSLAISNLHDRGTMYNLGMGYKFKIGQRTGMNTSLGFVDQHINTDYVLLHRYYGAAMKVGLMF